MRVLQVTPFFPPSWESGGIAGASYEISRGLVKLGHQVTVFTTNQSILPTAVKMNRKLRTEDMDVYYFDNLRRFLPGVLFPPVPYYLPFVATREITRHDVVHIHDYRNLLSVMTYHSMSKTRRVYVVQCHGSIPPVFQKTVVKKLFDTIEGRRILTNASLVIALDHIEAGHYRDMGVKESRIRIIPNGVNLQNFEDLPNRGAFRRRFGVSDETKMILYIGRISAIKGIDLLIRAFALLTKKIPDARLVIAGPDAGALRDLRTLALQLHVDDKTILPGPLFKRDKAEAFIDSDAFVLPSIQDTFPLTVLEAWGFKTPVIVTETCNVAGLVRSAGFVTARDEQELCDVISRVLTNRLDVDTAKAEGYRLVKSRFNWDAVTRSLVVAYEECLDAIAR